MDDFLCLIINDFIESHYLYATLGLPYWYK